MAAVIIEIVLVLKVAILVAHVLGVEVWAGNRSAPEEV